MGKAAVFLKGLLRKLPAAFNNLKIRYKLVLSYFLVTIIPITAIGVFSYNSTLKYIRSQYYVTAYNTQQQFNVNLTNRLSSYKYLADAIYNDQKLQTYLDGTFSGYYKGVDIVNDYISPVLTVLLESTGKRINLDMVKYSDSSFEVITNFLHGITNASSKPNNELKNPEKAFNIFNMERIQEKEWYSKVKNIDSYFWGQIGDDAEYDRITLVSSLISFDNPEKKKIGLLFITVMLGDILEGNSASNPDTKEFHMVFGNEGNLLSIDEPTKSFYVLNRDKLSGLMDNSEKSMPVLLKDYIVVEGVNSLTGWKILSAIPIKMLNENAGRTRNVTILYCLIALIVLFVITNLLSGSFSRRIIKISGRMRKFQEGDFDCLVVDVHNDEIGYLARAFNNMAERIGSLIRDNYQANVDKKEAQLRALQAQINPHFLYNSLSCISRLGNVGDSPNINKMVKALTVFYRMTLNKGRDIISISDELEQVKAYIEVYGIRKGEDFTVRFRLDEAIFEYYTIKVILQPFVENILEHAIYNRKNPINIVISAGMDGKRILFEIIDDGIGINEKRLNSILTDKNLPGGGYGIMNVDDRIKLHFGNEFGVSIYSRPGIGTKVSVVIPANKC